MDAGRFPGGISLPVVPRAEPQKSQRLPAIGPRCTIGWAPSGNSSIASGFRPPSTGRDVANKPFVLAVQAYGKPQLGIRGNLLTKN